MIRKFQTGHRTHVLEVLIEVLKENGNKPVMLDGRRPSLKTEPHYGCVFEGMKEQGEVLRLPLFGKKEDAMDLETLTDFLDGHCDQRYIKLYDNRNKGLFHVSRIDDFGKYYVIL